jgi:hypothetical protein
LIATYGDIHALLSDSLEAAHDILLHLHKLRELLGQVRAEGATGIATKGVSEAALSEESTGLG